MRKLLSFSLLIINLSLSQAQAPDAFKYQAIARDNSGNPLASQTINFKINLIQGSANGSSIYEETHLVTTNSYGLVNLSIGEGSITTGNLSTIDWSSGPYFIQIGIDVDGGSNFQTLGTSQMLSVPYALYATASGSSIPGPKGETGDTGPTGPTGSSGPKGDKGDPGDQGPQGLQGLPGNDGADGAQGLQGIQGLKGDKGDKGDTGDQGSQGLQGPPGNDGADGAQGLQGIQGLKGDKGDTGNTGPRGLQGIQGSPGQDANGGSQYFYLTAQDFEVYDNSIEIDYSVAYDNTGGLQNGRAYLVGAKDQNGLLIAQINLPNGATIKQVDVVTDNNRGGQNIKVYVMQLPFDPEGEETQILGSADAPVGTKKSFSIGVDSAVDTEQNIYYVLYEGLTHDSSLINNSIYRVRISYEN